ncbi:MAG: GNAT family N-acetyltransferase [Planctomycetota bacterium]|nr:MAG: GNAT family N-acetyltransferase [Planctomycetota bacterium]
MPTVRLARPEDQAAAYYVCLKTGDHGRDGEPFYRDDPDALGRIFVGPYLAFEPELSLVVEDEQGVCGYCLAALDSRAFYQQYDRRWRPALCEQFPYPAGDPATWTRAEHVHSWYHHPEYFCPEPYASYPSHMHIDLLERVRGQGIGRQMMQQQVKALAQRGSPGAHLAVSLKNTDAQAFYARLGFHELARTADDLYLGQRFTDS